MTSYHNPMEAKVSAKCLTALLAPTYTLHQYQTIKNLSALTGYMDPLTVNWIFMIIQTKKVHTVLRCNWVGELYAGKNTLCSNNYLHHTWLYEKIPLVPTSISYVHTPAQNNCHLLGLSLPYFITQCACYPQPLNRDKLWLPTHVRFQNTGRRHTDVEV